MHPSVNLAAGGRQTDGQLHAEDEAEEIFSSGCQSEFVRVIVLYVGSKTATFNSTVSRICVSVCACSLSLE